jgi:TatD DNase family protein
MFIDSHAHLTSESVLPELPGIVLRAKAAGVGQIVNICTDEASLREGIKLVQAFPWIHLTAATTPHDVETEGESFFPIVETHARAGKLVAIGETGLDYFYEHSNRKLQKAFLLRYFELALSCKLPLIFHCRDAFVDLFSFADSDYQGPAILHCFTGSIEEARGVLDRGWLISLSGIITFKKSETLREVARYVPLDRLLIETDTPYLAPQSHRGKPNEPAYIRETAQMIAQVKGITLEQVAAATSHNARTFFSL